MGGSAGAEKKGFWSEMDSSKAGAEGGRLDGRAPREEAGFPLERPPRVGGRVGRWATRAGGKGASGPSIGVGGSAPCIARASMCSMAVVRSSTKRPSVSWRASKSALPSRSSGSSAPGVVRSRQATNCAPTAASIAVWRMPLGETIQRQTPSSSSR
jgi:hypothetical protein